MAIRECARMRVEVSILLGPQGKASACDLEALVDRHECLAMIAADAGPPNN